MFILYTLIYVPFVYIVYIIFYQTHMLSISYKMSSY